MKLTSLEARNILENARKQQQSRTDNQPDAGKEQDAK